MIVPRRTVAPGALLVAATIVIGSAVTFVGAPPIDEAAVREARSLRDGWFYRLMLWLSDVGYSRWLIPAALVVSLPLGVLRARWRDALIVAFATTTAAVVTRVLKETFERARPSDGVDLLVAGFSMPSGHSSSSAAFVASLLIVTRHPRARRVAWAVLPLFALLVGVSRVVLGAHYPSDVVAGFCSGVGVTLLVASAVRAIPGRRLAARELGHEHPSGRD